MATERRLQRLGSLLREVITEVIGSEVRHPDVAPFTSVTRVDISKDLRHAKVYVSVMGDKKEKTIEALQKASKFIAINSSKRMTIRFFPELLFKLDDAVEAQLHIDNLLKEIEEEKSERGNSTG
jgi:ribosome-binding factor A